MRYVRTRGVRIRARTLVGGRMGLTDRYAPEEVLVKAVIQYKLPSDWERPIIAGPLSDLAFDSVGSNVNAIGAVVGIVESIEIEKDDDGVYCVVVEGLLFDKGVIASVKGGKDKWALGCNGRGVLRGETEVAEFEINSHSILPADRLSPENRIEIIPE